MGWSIIGGPEDVHPGGYDGSIWRWWVTSDAGDNRAVFVKISRTAEAVAPETLPDVTRRVRETRGQNAVETFLNWIEPPHVIEVGTTTTQPRSEGGVRPGSLDDPGAVMRVREIETWFRRQGWTLDLGEVAGRWVAAMVPPDFQFGPAPAFDGETPLDAAEAARAWLESSLPEIRETGTVELSAFLSGEAGVEADLTVYPSGIPSEEAVGEPTMRPTPTELERIAEDVGRHIGWTRLNDGTWLVAVYDDQNNLLDMAAGDNLDDLLLAVYEQLQPAPED